MPSYTEGVEKLNTGAKQLISSLPGENCRSFRGFALPVSLSQRQVAAASPFNPRPRMHRLQVTTPIQAFRHPVMQRFFRCISRLAVFFF
jgi:hypothetical protein